MRADGGVEHSAAAARTNDAKTSGPVSESTGQAHYDGNSEKNEDTEFH
jgi:hypothetical protein